MRVESPKQLNNGGWWHRSTDITYGYTPKPKRDPPRPIQGFEDMLYAWSYGSSTFLERLAQHLKLGVSSLVQLGTTYAKPFKAYAFPMYWPNGKVVGIRLRNNEGKKWAIKGSKAGLFIPFKELTSHTGDLFICEGPTDTAAALTLGLCAIGRHACLGQEEMVAQVVKDVGVKTVYIVCDNDLPGLRGARKLAQTLKCNTHIVLPPAKDLRQFICNGGTRDLLFSMIRELHNVV